MTTRWVCIALVVGLALGCKKADKKAPDEADEPAAAVAEAPVEAMPALTAPPPGAAELTPDTCVEDFAKLELAETPPAPAADVKVEPEAISKEGIPTTEVPTFAGAEATGFRVSYGGSQVPLHQQFEAILKEVQLYEKIATSLNSTVKMPRAVDIQLVDCGTVNAFYDPNNSRIIMCWELMSYFADMFKPVAKNDEELGNAILGATIFAFFHEAGHGLIHQLDLPTPGREEDVVDSFATVILIAGGDEAVAMALSGAYWFQLQSQQGHETPFYDEHAFDQQRFYNILCWIYGSDPEKYQTFVESGTLPESRAARCPGDYAKTKRSWEKLLEPHMTEQGAENASLEQPAAPVTPAAPAHAITCLQTAEAAMTLLLQQMDEQMKGAPQEQIDEVVKQLETQLPQMLQQLVDDCEQKDWPDQARECVTKAKTFEAASACGV
jgi:hypothetical protein